MYKVVNKKDETVENGKNGLRQWRFGGPLGKWTTMDLDSDAVLCVRMRNYFKVIVCVMILLLALSGSMSEVVWLNWAAVAVTALFLVLILMSIVDSRIIYRIVQL